MITIKAEDEIYIKELVDTINQFIGDDYYGLGNWQYLSSVEKRPLKSKPKEQPSQRIEISISEYSKYCEVEGEYRLTTSKCIPKEKLPLIKRCIEYVLNDDAKGYWKLVDELLPGQLKYTQTEVDELREKAFNASREEDNSFYYYRKTYPTFQDYKNTNQ